MFALACRWDMRTDNPGKGIERNYEIKRKRYLSGEELAALTKALAAHEDKQAANVMRVCLLSGCRVGEARSMRWADVDLTKGVWTKLGSTVKQKTDHVVPLSAPLRHLLADIRRSMPIVTRSNRSVNGCFPALAARPAIGLT